MKKETFSRKVYRAMEKNFTFKTWQLMVGLLFLVLLSSVLFYFVGVSDEKATQERLRVDAINEQFEYEMRTSSLGVVFDEFAKFFLVKLMMYWHVVLSVLAVGYLLHGVRIL